MKRFFAAVLAVALLLALCACGGTEAKQPETGDGKTEPTVQPGTEEPQTIKPEKLALAAANYGDVFSAITASRNEEMKSYGGARTGVMEEAAADAAVEAPAAEPEAEYNGGGDSDYSTTNVQIDGIDEGDIVKTDGEYIYVLHNLDFIIFKADGASVSEVSRLTVGISENEERENYWSGKNKSPSELYVSGGKAAVISNYYAHANYMETTGEWKYENEDYCAVDLYDISDKSAPVLVNSCGQDGGISSSRLLDGRLYVVTNYYVWDPIEGDTGTFIPRLYKNGVATLVDPGMIYIPRVSSTTYTVASVYDLESGEMTATKALLASGGTVYMDKEQLIVAGTKHQEDASEPRTESVYKVVDYDCYDTTELTVFSVADGGLEYTTTAVVRGYLESQFSMDRYNGYLRIVTTQNSYGYTVYTDEALGFENYKWPEDGSKTFNNLYVLDGGMNVVGKLENLAEGERVYSARFDGDIGYFVTFKNIDPLFSVDLSDPANPTILSELKIPGFSEYLHVWSDGMLLGLGYDTRDESYGDNTWTTTDGLKLSMFDVSDPANVTEKWKLSTEYDYSSAVYNHKAIMISAAKNLIAFPAEGGYAVYGFSPEGGFYEKAFIECSWDWNARGLWIGDFVYVVSSDRITVLDLATMQRVGEVSI